MFNPTALLVGKVRYPPIFFNATKADSYLWWARAMWTGHNNHIKSKEVNTLCCDLCSPVIYFLRSILSLFEKAQELIHQFGPGAEHWRPEQSTWDYFSIWIIF